MLTVRTNMLTMTLHRNLKNTGKASKRTANRLSSGFRINSATDDAAGLAISEKMRAQIRGLNQAHRNVQDGIALIQTAEGGMAGISEMVQRIRELVVQASNDTSIITNREKIQQEINQLVNEIDSLSARTNFNTRILLSGAYARNPAASLQSTSFGAVFSTTPFSITPFVIPGIQTPPIWWNQLATMTSNGTSTLNPSHPQQMVSGMTGAQGTLAPHQNLQQMWYRNLSGLQNHLNTFAVAQGFTSFENFLQNVGPAEGVGGASFYDFGGVGYGFRALVEYTARMVVDTTCRVVQQGGNFVVQHLTTFRAAYSGSNRNQFIAFWNAMDNYIINVQNHDSSCGNMNFGQYWARHVHRGARVWVFEEEPPLPPEPPIYPTPPEPPEPGTPPPPPIVPSPPIQPGRGNGLWIQKGANSSQGMFITIESMTARSLGLRNELGEVLINVTKSQGSEISPLLRIADAALAHISKTRAELGAKQNRLEFAAQSLSISSENLQDAESRIRDADMAKEMMENIKSAMLTQSITALFAQVRQQPEMILQLMR